jgi:uncharacterized protein (DUF1330 family)
MPALLVGTISVTDPESWARYVQAVGATFAPHGGRVLGRGVLARRLAGDSEGERVVVVEFPDLAALTRWHDSSEYQALVPLREAGARVSLAAYEA